MENENYIYRKQKLREEGLIEIPMSIDPARYFIANIRWIDVLFTSPFALLSVLMISLLQKTGNLTTSTFLFSFLPPVLVLTLFWVKHPDRKNISFITTIWWKIKFMTSKTTFEYSKEVKKDMDTDIRTQLGIYNIANDCFETLDDKLVKVVKVSSINLTGISFRERDKIYSSYQTFLNDYAYDAFPFQINQFSEPVNLKNYLNWVNVKVSNEKDKTKRMLAKSYIQKANEIQKNKNMVSKARYIILSVKVGANKEKALLEIDEKAKRMVSGIENMLSDRHKLKAHILDNEELFGFIYSSIDYENAQIRQSIQKNYNIKSPFSFGEKTYEDALKNKQTVKDDDIYEIIS